MVISSRFSTGLLKKIPYLWIYSAYAGGYILTPQARDRAAWRYSPPGRPTGFNGRDFADHPCTCLERCFISNRFSP